MSHPRAAARAWPLFGFAPILDLAACAAPGPATPPSPAPPPAATRPASLVVLLPEPDGSTGRVTVSNAAGAQELAQPFEATWIEGPDRGPTPPARLEPAEVERLVGAALRAVPPEPATFLLYFREGSDDLVADSRALLPDIVRAVATRGSPAVAVIGHTDSVGAADANQRLGLRRAVRVGDLLRALGVDPAILDIASHGEGDPLVPTADEVAEPRNRRVEVTVR